MGRDTRRQRTPGIVSTASSGACWAAWKARMLLYAWSKASRLSWSSCASPSSCARRPPDQLRQLLALVSWLVVVEVHVRNCVGCAEIATS